MNDKVKILLNYLRQVDKDMMASYRTDEAAIIGMAIKKVEEIFDVPTCSQEDSEMENAYATLNPETLTSAQLSAYASAFRYEQQRRLYVMAQAASLNEAERQMVERGPADGFTDAVNSFNARFGCGIFLASQKVDEYIQASMKDKHE
jgi:hypothetical protein